MGFWTRHVLVLGALSVVASVTTTAQDAALQGAITRQLAQLTGGAPRLDTVRMAALDESGSPAAIASYSVLGPSSGYSGFLVYVRRASRWTMVGNVSLGQGRVVGVRDGLIEGEELKMGPNDPRCCPTQKASRFFALQRGRLVEVVDARPASGTAPVNAAADPDPRAPFTTEVRHVRTGGRGAHREVTVLLRLANVSSRSLVLAYDPGHGTITDDRGNEYTQGRTLGLGAVNPPVIDASFRLEPGNTGDVLLQFDWPGRPGQLFGLEYAMRMPIRELESLPGGRWRPARTHLVEHPRLMDGVTVPATGASTLLADACKGERDCSASGSVIARLRRATTSMWGGVPYTRLDVRFENVGSTAIALCFSSRSASGMDDRGNPYAMHRERGDAVRGIPVCEVRAGDVSFALAPGASRDATLEYNLWGMQGSIRGERGAFSFAVRPMEEQPGNQVTQGRELPILFRDVALMGGTTTVASTAGAPGDGANSTGTRSNTNGGSTEPSSGQPDPCAGLTSCYAAGPFTAQLTSVMASRETGYRHLRLGVRVRNVTREPLVLCFASGSGVAIDDQQHRYSIREDIGVRGFGLCQGQVANPQFVVQPGAARDGALDFNVGIYTGQEVFGSTFNVSFALDQITLLPGNQLQKSGQHVVTFDDVTPGRTDGAGRKGGVLDLLKKAVRKPGNGV